MSRSDYVPNLGPEVTMYRTEYVPKWRVPKWSCPETSGAPWTEQWRLVTDSNEPKFVNMLVAKVYSHFKVSNVNKSRYFLRNRINSICMLLLSMYTFIILTMWLCIVIQRSSCQKRTEWSEDLIHTHILKHFHPNKQPCTSRALHGTEI